MTPEIQIDDDVFELLKHHAEPFTDTPNDVLRRLLLGASASPTGRTASIAPASVPSRRAQSRTRSSGATAKSPKRRRAPSDALLSEHAYELPLLRALEAAGGRLPTREAIATVGEEIADHLMPMDHDVLAQGRQRWEMRVQFVRLRLVEDELLKRDSPRGVWEISDAGRERLEREAVAS